VISAAKGYSSDFALPRGGQSLSSSHWTAIAKGLSWEIVVVKIINGGPEERAYNTSGSLLVDPLVVLSTEEEAVVLYTSAQGEILADSNTSTSR
jgi:hypothetical protein